jgi:hypothetical protein
VNLLREGLDLPEVSLVAILDADKEGFLRSETSLIQTIGRAARNVNAKVILYADKVTDAMQRAIDETAAAARTAGGVQRRARHHARDDLYGLARRRSWARNAWVRCIHLGMIATVVILSIFRLPCPLTVWERNLRLAAGEVLVGPNDFIGFWLRRLIFVPVPLEVLHMLYVAFGAVVLGLFVLAPPRFRSQRREARELKLTGQRLD